MGALVVRRADEETTWQEWQHVHNLVIPADPLTMDEVRERAVRNRLEVAHVGGELVGCSTVRPPTTEEPMTVIVRVLPARRRRGLGSSYLDHVMSVARATGSRRVQTIVLGSNLDGLEFALHRGFVETERYTLEGATVPYIHLVRDLDGD